jgi:hypothetical protein
VAAQVRPPIDDTNPEGPAEFPMLPQRRFTEARIARRGRAFAVA